MHTLQETSLLAHRPPPLLAHPPQPLLMAAGSLQPRAQHRGQHWAWLQSKHSCARQQVRLSLPLMSGSYDMRLPLMSPLYGSQRLRPY